VACTCAARCQVVRQRYNGYACQSTSSGLVVARLAVSQSELQYKNTCQLSGITVVQHKPAQQSRLHKDNQLTRCIVYRSLMLSSFPLHLCNHCSWHLAYNTAQRTSTIFPATSPALPASTRPSSQPPHFAHPRANSQLRPIPQRHILPCLIKPTAPCPMRLARLHRVNSHVSDLPPCITLNDEARLVFIRLT
jgi:hypothetical protein